MKDLLERIGKLGKEGLIEEQQVRILHHFFSSYGEAATANGNPIASFQPCLEKYLLLILDQIKEPHHFDHYHQRVTSPFDYYRFGLDFIRPLIMMEKSKIEGEHHFDAIAAQLAKGENVIFFANHQTEPDPQAISLLLEPSHPKIAEEMIMVAGHRVVTDPLAIPFSMGRNLLCIYSKNYMDFPPEEKRGKIAHNQKTMKKMRDLLSEGGKCIYVAPSGGRDRPNQEGKIEVASFDPQSIEMFWFTSQHAKRPTHFYPLALATFNLLPPPVGVNVKLGEQRSAQCTPISLAIGEEIDMEHFPDSDCTDKHQKRQYRGDYIWKLVKQKYALIR